MNLCSGQGIRVDVAALLHLLLCLLMLSSCGQEPIQELTLAAPMDHVHDLRQDQNLPDALAGTWLCLKDDSEHELQGGQLLMHLSCGTYRQLGTKNDSELAQVLCLRANNSVAAYASSLIGIESSAETDRLQLQAWAEQRARLNPVTLIVQTWRLADDFAWPWVSNVGLFDGLAGICEHLNVNKTGYAFDPQQGVYVNQVGLPIVISLNSTPVQAWGERKGETEVFIALGDVIAASDSDTQRSCFGILIADRGKIGYLDPTDEILSAFVPPDQEPGKIQAWKLGYLLGPAPVHVYARHKQRALSVLSRYRPDNPIWQLSKERQWMTLAGMIIVILVLMRRQRQYRRRQKD